jgi:putative transposase
VVFLDGFGMGEHLLVGALGVTADGTKVPLGVVEGTTENKAVCTRLVTGLGDRGLDPDRGVLFVIDGGKALGAAVRTVVGAKALVQRCRRPRNPTSPTTRRSRAAAGATPAALGVANPDPDHAQHELEALARGLARQRPGAAASLREAWPRS